MLNRRSTGQWFLETLRQIRAIRAKKLLQQYVQNGHRRILFTDEKIFFPLEEKFNRQIDRVYAHNPRVAADKNAKSRQRTSSGLSDGLVRSVI